MNAGIGWGGSCFPKDVKALVHIAQEFGTQPQLLQAVIEINKYQRKHVVQKFEEIFGDIKGKRIGILGLAFKPDTDDIRESPAVDIIKYLTQKGAIISAYDPAAMELSKLVLPKEVSLYENPYQVVEGTDALLLATEWNEFKQLDFEKIHQLMHGNVILDGRNLWDPQSLTDLGFRYYGIGLGQYK